MTSRRPRPRVLYSFGPPEPAANPYTTLLAERVAADADVTFFSWPAALRGRYDTFHVQWPESLVRLYSTATPSRASRLVKFVLASTVLLLNRVRGKKLVWTVHNRTPHEQGPLLERSFIRLFLRLVDHTVFLNAGETDESGRPSTVILHPDYKPVASPAASPGNPTELLLFGHLRPYKGIEQLMQLVEDDPDLGELRVAGHSADPAYGRALTARADASDRITVQTGHLGQDALNRLISDAGLVVLPYKYVYNSGALLLALTVNTPVLIRSSPTTRAVRDEVGNGWVSLFDDTLEPDDVASALEAAREVDRAVGPDLSHRSWDECASRHLELYRGLHEA
ncbi:glycosyltransferase family protein [Frondihabitans cladoniiphilus]|uniref:GDP-mannose--glycolipid 4-beta-D-mannosyltransferase n=1 Tax=Frondihabitans cladoniiphilus TaxID=715785 RepID=A0ABP8VYW8_9MICO